MTSVKLKELTVLRQRGACCELPPVDVAWAESTAELLKALADPTRLAMVTALKKAQAPVCICDFVAAMELTQPTISHHMARLKEAGLVEPEKRGIWIYYRLAETMEPQAKALLGQLLG
jgi:ArsR family transcriptional regulator